MSASNMELQAILDSTDSDSESGREETKFLLTDTTKIRDKSSSTYSRQFDLERILREHSDDEDDDHALMYPLFDDKNRSHAFGTGGKRHDYHNSDEISLGATTISTRPFLFTPKTPPTLLKGYKQKACYSPSSNTDNSGNIQRSPPLSPSFSKVSGVSDLPRFRTSFEAGTRSPPEKKMSTKESRLTIDKEISLSEAKGGQMRLSKSPTPHKNQNAGEWAILQKILIEADSEDDDDVGFTLPTNTSLPTKKGLGFDSKMNPTVQALSDDAMKNENSQDESDVHFRMSMTSSRVHSNNSNLDVDAIINAIDSDSDDDAAADFAELDEMIARFSIKAVDNKRRKMKERNTYSNTESGIRSDHKFTTSGKLQMKRDTSSLTNEISKNKSLDKGRGKDKDGGDNNKIRDDDSNREGVGNVTATSINTHVRNYQPLSQRYNAAVENSIKTAEEYERRLLRPGQRDIVSPLMVKRRMKPKIELNTKSRCNDMHQKRSRITPQQNAQFKFSEMIETSTMQRIGVELKRNVQCNNDIVGLPTAISIGSKFIAIGTQRGIVLVFDLFEELRQKLDVRSENTTASSRENDYGSISSIGMAANGENVVAGYTNGSIVLWDVIKGTILKTVSDLHSSPITVVRFISEKALSVVSVDAGGLVNKITFVKAMLFSTYTTENECLLDGTAGQILAVDILSPISSLKTIPMRISDNKKQSYHSSIHRLVLLALSSERSSFGIAIEPTVSVLHRWARPTPEQMNVDSFVPATCEIDSNDAKPPPPAFPSTFLPCLTWGWALVSGGENSVTPILARGWGCFVQLLRVNFPPCDDKSDDAMLWPAFGVHDEFEVKAPVVALEWLGNRSLVYLSLTNELTIVDTVMMTLVERLDLSGMKLVYAEFALSRSITAKSTSSTANNCVSTTFQNSIQSSEERLIVLCQEEVKTVSILGIQQRIVALEESGEWLEALALALDHYESTIASQEDRKRNSDGSFDLSDHPEFVSRIRLTEDEEWIADLLLRYLHLAVENAPDPVVEPSSPFHRKGARIDLAQSHYQMLAGVCIEFCVVTRRLDLLFNEIYQRFLDTGYTWIFLDVLEPYVLNDKVKYIAPLVMADFVDHCREANDVATVERCLLHMDVTIMDFDSILSLLQKNSMYSALIYIYTQGLDDFVSPLIILFEGLFDALDSGDASNGKAYGYKILLFLQHCFQGKLFPTGSPLMPEDRLNTLRPELLACLIRKVYTSSAISQPVNDIGTKGCRLEVYPYLRVLLNLDSKAFLSTLALVFDDPEACFIESIDSQHSIEEWQNMANERIPDNNKTICPDRMTLVRIISMTMSNYQEFLDNGLCDVSTSEDIGAFHDFMAKYMLKGVVRAPASIIRGVISRMCTKFSQDDIIHLLQILPKSSYEREEMLAVVEGCQIPRAALILHKGGVSEIFEGDADSVRCATHFISAIDCYLNDDDIMFRREVFGYIKNECIGGGAAIIGECDKNKGITAHDVLRNALCKRLPALINLDSVPCAQLVAEIYVEELEQILISLEEAKNEMVQFKFFHAIISGNLAKVDAVAGPVLLANLTIDHHQKYLELMAKFHPDLVYHHLISSDNYRVEECLKLCQAYDIADASAYLLERMGNVSSALQLMLQTLEGRLMTLKRVVRGLSLSSSFGRRRMKFGRTKDDTRQMVSSLHRERESHAVNQMLTVALDLCERNSGPSSNSEHGSQLWFNVLDRLINAKGFLRLSKELQEHSAIMLDVLSDLLRMTMHRMVSNVALPDLVRKITTDHAGSRLGEFREMITTMLKTYLSELDVCSRAVEVLLHDVQKMSMIEFRLKVRGTKVNESISITERKNLESTLRISSIGILSPIREGGGELNAEKKDVKKLSALSRMRRKRQKKSSSCKSKNNGQSKVCLGLLTTSDRIFQMGESSDAAYMPRCVGILSDAEHYGRLR